VAIDVALGLSLLTLAELVSGYLIWLGQFLVFDPLRFCAHFVSFLVYDPLRCCADLKPALAVVYGCVLWLWQFLAALGVRRLAEAHPKRLRVLLLPLPLSVPLLPHSAPQTERLLVEAPMVALTISPCSVSL
jgi:hypothetical protein